MYRLPPAPENNHRYGGLFLGGLTRPSKHVDNGVKHHVHVREDAKHPNVSGDILNSEIPNLTLMLNTTEMKQRNETPLLRFVEDGTLNIKSNLETDVYHVGQFHMITQHDLIYQMNSSKTDSEMTINDVSVMGNNQEDETGEVVRTAKPSFITTLLANAKSSIMGGGTNDIADFMKKPVQLYRGSFATTDGPATFSVRGLFAGLDDPIRLDKLKGNYSLRATTVITLEANGTPFQSGLYILASMPTGGAAFPGVGLSKWANQHRFSRTQITQLNHVILDVNTDKKVQLRAPFISGMSSHNIASSNNEYKQGNPGIFFLYPYLPLEVSSGGSVTVPYTVWLHYEDVELFGSAIPQSKRSSGKYKKDILEAESKAGPLEQTLTIASISTGLLATVPTLSAIMTPLSYVTGAMAGVAKYFGLSKPPLLEKQVRVVESLAPYIGSCDMHSNAMPLSVYADNHVGVVPGFAGVDIDEMSIDYVKAIPAFYASFIWPFTSTSGTVLYFDWTDPSKYYTSSTDGISTLYSFTPVGMLGSLFAQWQGSIRITLRFAKTQFHAGRLAFIYNLQDQASTMVAATQTNLPYTYKHIIDLSKGSDFTFELPYIANTEWCLTGFDSDAGQQSPGKWSIMVVDPLIYAATVPNSIRCVVEVAGGKDLHFAVPKQFSGVPCSILNFQSGMVEKENVDSIEKTMVGTTNVTNYHQSCANSTGEIINSLRCLIKRGGLVMNGGTGTNTTSFSIGPHISYNYNNNAAAVPSGVINLDPYNLISSFYVLGRGGFRTSLTAASGQSAVAYWIMWFATQNATAPAWSSVLATFTSTFSQSLYATTGFSLAPIRGGEFKGVQTPQYLQAHSRNIPECTVYATSTTVPGFPSSPMVDKGAIYLRSVGTLTAQYVYRAVADDHTLGGFVSIPPMYFPPAP